MSLEELENRYYAILEEQYALKTYCGLSFEEQQWLTAEDRRWWIKRFKKDEDEKKNKSSS